MLSIGKIAAGPLAARYYTDQIARGRDDYYAGKREEPGRWDGAGAAALGWSGEIDPEQFASLLAGAGLRRPPASGAVAGFDLTFRAPKSVSVLWAIAPADIAGELRRGHDAAVREALDYLERTACWARRGAGGQVQVRGAGFVAAGFLHRASRAGDPLLHTHVVVGNLTLGPDGKWTALDARHLYRHARTAGFLYQAVLRRELTDRLGLEFLPVENGVADVRGVPRAVIEHFSTRRAEIVTHLAEHGAHSAKAAQIAALETRRAKDEPPLERQLREWRARAAEHGLDGDRIAELFGRLALHDPGVRGIDVEQLTEHTSSFGRPEVLQALAQAQPTGARVEALERLADNVLAQPAVVRLEDRPTKSGVPEARYSTRELLDLEAELLATADARRDTHTGVVGLETFGAVLRDHGNLTVDQREVLHDLVCDGHGITVIRAAAGTGKTYVLDAARDAWQRRGCQVMGCAMSARASRELTDQSAIQAHTIAAIRHGLKHGYELPRGSVLVVDEAGMVGTRALADLAKAAQATDTKLVLVGDDRQLPEIQAGGAFRALADRQPAHELREVLRQRQPWDRAGLDALRSGDVERWARAYRDAGRITVAPTNDKARVAMVNDWSHADGDTLMIAARRSDVRDLNDRAREMRRARGDLTDDEITIAGRGFAAGDRVLTTRNDRTLGVLNGQRGTVARIDPERETITVTFGDREVTLDPGYLHDGHLDHGYATTAHRAQGATVDRSFVLGSEDLYREWGYTALSRHRDESRFYVTQELVETRGDQAPEVDPLITGIQRLLSRSNAHELASESLPDATREALDAERAALREQFRIDPPPKTLPHVLDRDIEHAQDALERTRERQARLHEQRDALRFYERTQRAELDDLLDGCAEQQRRDQAKVDQALHARDRALGRDQSWLTRNRDAAGRLCSINDELAQRDHADRDAAAQLDAHERLDPTQPPHPPEPAEVPHPADHLDLAPPRPTPAYFDLGR